MKLPDHPSASWYDSVVSGKETGSLSHVLTFCIGMRLIQLYKTKNQSRDYFGIMEDMSYFRLFVTAS